jgi:hypothetical protein
MSVISTGPAGGLYVKGLTDVLGIGATIDSKGALVAVTGPEIRRVTANPNGTFSDFGGSLALDVTNGLLYVNTSKSNTAGTTWSVVTTSPITNNGAAIRLFSLTTPAADFSDNLSGAQTFVAGQVTIPANTLQAGSIIRVRLAGNLNQAGVGTLTLALSLGAGPTVPVSTAALNFANANNIVVDFSFTVRAVGAAVNTAGSVSGAIGAGAFSNQSAAGANLNTTAANVLSLIVNFSAAAVGTNFDINEYEVTLYP